jgi:large conductance mechanosensitive channel
MSVLSEFKAFALKGNVMDLAVGVIIGAAFGKIVDSLVNDVLMPLLGKVFGVVDFSDLYIKLGPTPSDIVDNYETLKKAGVPLLAYGHFLTIVVNFILLAFVVFLMVKQMNKLKGEVPAPSTPEDIALLREIRDSLNR